MGKAMHYLFSMAIGMALTAVALTGQGRDGRQGGQPTRVGPEAPPIGFFGSYRNMEDKKDPSKLPIIGAWRVNFERSDPSYKAAGRFKATGTTIYTAVDGGIKTETFLFYPPKDDSYKTTFTDDGREYWVQARCQGLQGPAGAQRSGPDGQDVAGRQEHAVPRADDQGCGRRACALSRVARRQDAHLDQLRQRQRRQRPPGMGSHPVARASDALTSRLR
jgi:hypothetical protein